MLADITSVEDLPRGIGDDQAAGHYRTRARDDEALFGFAATAQSAKPALFPPDEQLWRGTRAGEGFEVSPREPEPAPVALLGIRGCDLAAIGIHDTVLLGRGAVDAHYATRRAHSFLIAVTCATPAGHLLLRLDGHRAQARRGCRPDADRAAGPAPLPRRDRDTRGRGGPG